MCSQCSISINAIDTDATSMVYLLFYVHMSRFGILQWFWQLGVCKHASAV